MRSDGCGEGASSESMPQECWDLLHGASTPPPQAPSEPKPQECRAPQKAPNEAASSQSSEIQGGDGLTLLGLRDSPFPTFPPAHPAFQGAVPKCMSGGL